MGKKMSNAPVYYTVAQVQFNPILNVDSYLPSIQSQMRGMRFPDYKHEVFQQLILPFDGTDAGQVTPPSLAPQSRYLFGDMEGRSCFLLEQNAMSFQTTAYDTFETYSEVLLKGLSTLHAALRLDFVERIGLRYLDAVQPATKDDSLKDYLIPEVLGLSQKLDGQFAHSVSETVSMTKAGQLVSRVIIRNGLVGL